MSTLYDQQQLLGQGAGGVGVLSSNQASSHFSAQSGGQFGGQVLGQSGGQFGGQVLGQSGGQFGVQPVAPAFVQTTVQKKTEHFQTQQQGSSGQGERQRRQKTESTSSSSSSDRAYKVTAGAQQQYSAQGVYGAGESFGSAVSGQRRQGRYQKQVIRLPDQQQGQVRQVRHRLPTPEPDTLERVYIQRQGNEVVEEITEIPMTPPPRVQERTVVEPAGPPQVIKKVIRVPPRSGGYQQQGASYATNVGQGSSQLLSAGSYGNVQQAYGAYPQQSGYASTGYGGYAPPSYGGGYAPPSYGGGYQQQSYGYGGYPTQTAARSGVIPGATCFYV